MRSRNSSKQAVLAICPALAMSFAGLVGCESDSSDDNWHYGTDSTIDSTEDFHNDRDLDRNIGGVDSPNGMMNTDDDWLQGGSGGVGGVDDTGRGTGP